MSKILNKATEYIKGLPEIVYFKKPPRDLQDYLEKTGIVYYLHETNYTNLLYKDINIKKFSNNIMFFDFYSDDTTRVLYKNKYYEFSSFLGVYTFAENKSNLKEYKELFTIFENIGLHIYYYNSSADWDEEIKKFVIKDVIKEIKNEKKSRWTIKFESNLVSLNEQDIYLVEENEDKNDEIKVKSNLYMLDLSLYEENELRHLTNNIFKDKIVFNF